ncbi:MAG TPA: DUF2723 domain-containing protein [Phototrophicaceae bacterium]|nr:DUF2723 domain-containing protein [Phototrophicaceae bacterium]
MIQKRTLYSLLGLLVPLALLLLAYWPILQRIPNGSDYYYMLDVGETQVVLNKWGTLHATGYPLYVMTGSALVMLLRAFGMNPAAAPAVVSLIWGLLTLTLIYALALHLTKRPLIAAGLILLYGLTRTMWVYNDVAKEYTFTMFLLLLLLLITLWSPPISGRLYWLALIGGIAVGHHRALALAAPALVLAVWSELIAFIRKRPIRLLALIGLALIGLLPYAYLYFRGQTGALWVYGSPGTLPGLLDQFFGKEADHYVGLPSTLSGILANINLITSTVFIDVTVPGVLLGIVGLIVGLWTPRHRRAALVMLLIGVAAYSFHALFYTDILAALILMTTLSLSFGWLFLADVLLSLHWSDSFRQGGARPRPDLSATSRPASPYHGMEDVSAQAVTSLSLRARAAQRERQTPLAGALILIAVCLIFAFYQYQINTPFISSLTTDPTGQQTIAMAQHTPPGATLMLAWGPRYFAVGFARDVLGMLPSIGLADHKADYKAILRQGELVTAEYTFYNQPVSWWEQQIGTPIYLRAVAPDLVQIDTQPELEPADPDATTDVDELAHRIDCLPDMLVLRIAWHAERKPTQDLSVFVHLLDHSGSMIAQDDHSAPVYGWRPLTSWVPGEVVRDVYTLPRKPNADAISYGLYWQRPDGSFDNVITYNLPVECG